MGSYKRKEVVGIMGSKRRRSLDRIDHQREALKNFSDDHDELIKDMIDEYQKIDRMITSYLNDTYSNVIYNGNIHNTIREILYYSKIYEKDGAIFCKVEHLNHVDKENRCFVL